MRITEEKGFSLLELLFVSILLALMAGILYSSITGIMRSQEAVDDQRGTTKVAQAIFTRLISEISGITRDAKLFETTDCFTACPVEGENKGSRDNARDRIRFVSSNATQPVAGSYGNYGEVEVSYRLNENNRKNPFYDRERDRDLFVLVREEIPAEIDDEKILDKKRISTPIAYNVKALNFRYLKGNDNLDWEDQWDKRGNSLPPKAIEITLTLQGENGREETFRTAVHIPSSNVGRIQPGGVIN